ncbi:MAG: MFS transporter [Chloroflexi bacterium]|nr:MFS transporter [Chloroflexota bacterium]
MQNTRVAADDPLDEQRLGTTTQLMYAAGSIGTGAFYAFNNFVLPPVLKAFGAPDLLIGLLSSTRSIEGALIQPTVGALSDRIWTPLGRRRPFVLVGVPLSAMFFVAAAFVPDLGSLAVMIFLFSIFFNVAVDPYTALLADITPLHQRGWLSGLSAGVQLVSSVLFLLLVVFATSGGSGVPVWLYVVVAVVMVASFGVTAAGIREPRAVDHGQRLHFRAYMNGLLEQRQAMRYLGTLFVYQFGLNAILPYLVLFVVDDIGATEQVAFELSAALLVVTALAAAGFGKLGDRMGTRRILALGWLLLAVSAVAGVFVATLQQTAAVVLVAGVGNGAATAVSWPLLTALIPHGKTGVFAGLKAAAESIAIPLSVVVAAEVFLPWLGYRGIFAMLAVAIVLALVLLLCFVRVPRSVEPNPEAILVARSAPSRGGETGETRGT